MTREEKLQYAKDNYPIGTKYYPIDLYTGKETWGIKEINQKPQFGIGGGKNSIYGGHDWIYSEHTGTWAKIEGKEIDESSFLIF